jgi:hypothetical protein
MTANMDTDVPFDNVIGFLIPIQDIRLMIKKAIMPEEQPAEEPVSEVPPAEPEEEVTAE